jgi:hypothetical protein
MMTFRENKMQQAILATGQQITDCRSLQRRNHARNLALTFDVTMVLAQRQNL